MSSLPALKRETLSLADEGVELICVDNNSADNSVQLLQEAVPETKVILSQSNLGFAAAVNRGAEQARGKYLLFLNPDVSLDNGAIKKLGQRLEELSAAGSGAAVAGRMRHPDGSFQATCREYPTLSNIFFSRGSILGFLAGAKTYTLGDFTEATMVPAVAATCLLLRRADFEEVGGFDERFFMFFEDTDLCLRLRNLGCRMWFIPEVGGVHDWGEGGQVAGWRRALWHHQSALKYFRKHHPGLISSLFLPLALAVNFALRVLLLFLFRESRWWRRTDK